MSFSYNRVWDLSAGIVRTHFPLLLAIAGAFSFLPGLLLNHFMPPPAMTDADPQAALTIMLDYARANWHWYALWLLFGMTGTLAMSALILDERRPTVRMAIGEAAALLPTYVVCNILLSVVVTIGLMLIATLLVIPLGPQNPLVVMIALIPLLYALGRVAVLAQVIAAEDRRGPFNAIGRVLALTRGRGWRVAGLVVAIYLLVGLTLIVARAIVGIPLRLLLDAELATFIELIVTGAVGAILDVLAVAFYAGLYLSLSSKASETAVFD